MSLFFFLLFPPTRLLSVTGEMLWVLLIESVPKITGRDVDDTVRCGPQLSQEKFPSGTLNYGPMHSPSGLLGTEAGEVVIIV